MHSKTELKEKQQPLSVLDGDEKFLKKILSRDSSAERHSHVSLKYQSVGEVPFQWETAPGTPRNPSRATSGVIDVRSPPVVETVTLPSPRVTPSKKVGFLAGGQPQSCFRRSLWKSRSNKWNQEKKKSAFDHEDRQSFKCSNFGDGDYRPSARDSSSSSSSSSFRSANDDRVTVHKSSSSNLKGFATKINFLLQLRRNGNGSQRK